MFSWSEFIAWKNFEEIVAGILMVLMVLATFANVVGRYIFNHPIQWAEEFSRYTFLWIVFLGAAICTKHKRHIAIDSLVKLFSGKVQLYFYLFVDLLVLALMVVIVYYGLILCASATQTTATLKIPQYVVYLIVPVSAGFIFAYSLGDLRGHLHDLRLKGD